MTPDEENLGRTSLARDEAELREDNRRQWLAQRRERETHYRSYYGRRDGRIDWRDRVVRVSAWALKATGLFARGMANARRVHLNELEVALPELPPALDGFSILHVSDLHIGGVEGTREAVVAAVSGVSADLCVFTGDYRAGFDGGLTATCDTIRDIISAVDIRDGVFATLGNHDTYAMVEPFEALGLRVLGNESVAIDRRGVAFTITGIDDTFSFHTQAAYDALYRPQSGFRILLSHSAESAPQAAESGFHLFLCGHTHGGQICLPGGIPIITRMRKNRKFARAGLWQCGAMTGFTNSGAGVSILPVRFNTRSEICLMTLRGKSP